MKVFSKAKFLTDPGGSMLYQDLPQVREMIDKLDGQPITEPYIKIGLGECSGCQAGEERGISSGSYYTGLGWASVCLYS